MVLDNISFKDNYDSGYDEKRTIIYDLDFTAKTYLFGPIPDSTEGFIKKVQVDYYTDTNKVNASRQLRYVAETRAIQDYNQDHTSALTQDIDTNVTQFTVSDTTSLVVNTYIAIDKILKSFSEKNYKLSIFGVDVPSEVNEQPINEITKIGCENRMKNLIKYVDHFGHDYDFLVSIENDDNGQYLKVIEIFPKSINTDIVKYFENWSSKMNTFVMFIKQ